MELANEPGCYVLCSDRRAPETGPGKCFAGLAGGPGTPPFELLPRELLPSGTGPYVNGQRHGHWAWNLPGGQFQAGPYVNGQRHGRWVVQSWDGADIAQGPYADDKRNGRWVVRLAPGLVAEGPYVDDERHGEWIYRPAHGDPVTVVFEKGVRQEP